MPNNTISGRVHKNSFNVAPTPMTGKFRPRAMELYTRMKRINLLPKTRAPMAGIWTGATPSRVYLTLNVHPKPYGFEDHFDTLMNDMYNKIKAAAAANKKVGGGRPVLGLDGFIVKVFESGDEVFVGKVGEKLGRK